MSEICQGRFKWICNFVGLSLWMLFVVFCVDYATDYIDKREYKIKDMESALEYLTEEVDRQDKLLETMSTQSAILEEIKVLVELIQNNQ